MAKKKSRKEKKSKIISGGAPECENCDIENVHDSCHDHLQCSTSDADKDVDKDISNLTKFQDSPEASYESSNRDDVFYDDPAESMIETFKELSDDISNYKGSISRLTQKKKQYWLKQLNDLTVQVEKLHTEDTNLCLDNIDGEEKCTFMQEKKDVSPTPINPLADLETSAREIWKLAYGFNEISEFSILAEKIDISLEPTKYSSSFAEKIHVSSEPKTYTSSFAEKIHVSSETKTYTSSFAEKIHVCLEPKTCSSSFAEKIHGSTYCIDKNFNEDGINFDDEEPVYITELSFKDIVRLGKFLHTPLSGQRLWVVLLCQMIDKGHINLQKSDITGCKYPEAQKIGGTFMTCISTRRPGLLVDFFNNVCEKHGRNDISQLLQSHLGKKILLTDIPHLDRCDLERIIGFSHYNMSGDCHWKSLAVSLLLDNEVIQGIELCASNVSSRMEMEEVTDLLKTRCPSLTLQTIEKSLRELQIINAADEMQVIISEKCEHMKYRGGVAVPESVSLDDSLEIEIEIVMS